MKKPQMTLAFFHDRVQPVKDPVNLGKGIVLHFRKLRLEHLLKLAKI